MHFGSYIGRGWGVVAVGLHRASIGFYMVFAAQIHQKTQ